MPRYAEFDTEDYQWFPFYFEMGPSSFIDAASAPSGAAGSIATFTKSISNFPFIFHGVRVENTYDIQADWGADDIAKYQACKRFVDYEQSLKIELTQQNILSQHTLQSLVQGRNGDYFSPFPCPFPMAGANNITIEMQRITSYPVIGQDLIVPSVRVALVGCVGRNEKQTQPPHRVGAR